ncbi:MAG: pilus assembly protein [Aquisalinus sp.]|nr:pilus assembly protein [Aquisalinus sp.]
MFRRNQKHKMRISSWRRFIRRQDGSISVEFAIIGPLFFGLIFSAFESGLMYVKIATVELAMDEVVRQVYTGAVTSSNLNRDQLIDLFCDEIDYLMACDSSNVTLQKITFSGYGSNTIDTAICRNSEDDPDEDDLPDYSLTGSGQIVFLRFCITTDVLVPGLKKLTFSGANFALQLPETADGRYGITASAVFRNEPFAGIPAGAGAGT